METKTSAPKDLRKENFKLAYLSKIVPFLKVLYNLTKDGYVSIKTSELSSEHNLDFKTIPTMIDLDILKKFGGPKNQRLYKWNDQKWNVNLTPSDESYKILGEKIYERMNKNKSIIRINEKIEQKFNNEMKEKKLVRIIGSTHQPGPSEDVLIERAVNVAYLLLKEGSAISKEELIAAIKGEISNEELSNIVFESLKFLEIIKHCTFTQNLYIWKEGEPHTIMGIIKDAIKESKDKSGSTKQDKGISSERKERLWKALMWLYENLKDYKSINLREQLEQFRLFGNDVNALSKLGWIDTKTESPDPGKRGRKFTYKWMMPEPSPLMLDAYIKKISELAKSYGKNSKPQHTNPQEDLNSSSNENSFNDSSSVQPKMDKEQNIMSILYDLRTKRDAAQKEVERLDGLILKAQKIQEAEVLKAELSLEYNSISTNTIEKPLESSLKSSSKKEEPIKKHSREIILKIMSEKDITTFQELKDRIYPNLENDSNSVRAMQQIIQILNRAGQIKYVSKGVYSLANAS